MDVAGNLTESEIVSKLGLDRSTINRTDIDKTETMQ